MNFRHTGAEGPLLTLALLAGASVVLALALDASPIARVVPLAVAIPTIVLLAVQAALDWVPRLAGRWRRPEAAETGVATVTREVGTFFWVFVLLALAYGFGFLVAVPLYVLLFLKIRGGETWRLSIALSAAMGGLVYVISLAAFQVRLFEGKIWHWLGM